MDAYIHVYLDEVGSEHVKGDLVVQRNEEEDVVGKVHDVPGVAEELAAAQPPDLAQRDGEVDEHEPGAWV